MIMRAVSLWQPYASLLASGAKPYETRGHAPPAKLLGQMIAIHAAKRRPKIQDFSQIVLNEIEYQLKIHRQLPAFGLPLGAVVGMAKLIGAYRCGRRVYGQDGEQFEVAAVLPGSATAPKFLPVDMLGDYSPGRWVWRFANANTLQKPIEARGFQGFWTWDEANAA